MTEDMTPDVPLGQSDASMYSRLEGDRFPFLTRARANALLTIPALMPPEGSSGATTLSKPYQSIGSHGVNTLAAKLLNTLLPANSPVFRYVISDLGVADLAQDPTARAEVDKRLNSVERAVQDEIEGMSIRAALVEALKQLIVCGNVLLYLPKAGNLKMFRLDRYVVQRDYEGNLLTVIIKETMNEDVLPEAVQRMLHPEEDLLGDDDSTNIENKSDEVDVYTVFRREGNRLHMHQSVKGIVIPGSKGSWPLDKTPVMPLRWTYLHDEDYGRAYVDEYIGDLEAANALTKAIREAAAAASKFNPMVNPTGMTRAQDVANAANLQIINGRKEDVTVLQFDKQADMQIPQVVLQDLTKRLSYAFMMNQSVQRNGERVTAEEVRTMVSDIDDVLGGIYSLLAQELQYPLVVRIIDRMVRAKKIPNLASLKGPDGKTVVRPKIVTGVEALGRGQDFNKYMTFVTQVIQPLGPPAFQELNLSDLIKRAAVSLSIDTDGLLKSDDQKQQEAQDQQDQAMMGQTLSDVVKGAAPGVAKVAAQHISDQVAQQQGQQQ